MAVVDCSSSADTGRYCSCPKELLTIRVIGSGNRAEMEDDDDEKVVVMLGGGGEDDDPHRNEGYVSSILVLAIVVVAAVDDNASSRQLQHLPTARRRECPVDKAE